MPLWGVVPHEGSKRSTKSVKMLTFDLQLELPYNEFTPSCDGANLYGRVGIFVAGED